MELFQELVFTIFLSLIVSLLIAKLFSMASSCDDGKSTISKSFEEKIDKEWVVCDSEKEAKGGYFEDTVKVSEDRVFGYVEAELSSGVVIGDRETVGGVDEGYVFDEIPERNQYKDDAVGLVKSDKGNVEGLEPVLGSLIHEDCVKSMEVDQAPSAIDVGEVKIEDGDGVFDDDWQGVETTDLEKCFGAAVAFMGSKNSVDRVNSIDNAVKVQLYGLHRVAIEGSCFEPQPIALKVSARANWNAWKRFEKLGREDAMEQYVALLSQHIPDWMGSHNSEDDMQDSVATGTTVRPPSIIETQIQAQNERVLKQMNPCIDMKIQTPQ